MSYFPTNPLAYIAATWTDPNGQAWAYDEVKTRWFRHATPAGTGASDISELTNAWGENSIPIANTTGGFDELSGTDVATVFSLATAAQAFPGFGTTAGTALEGDTSAADIGAAPTAHAHVSADITDATSAATAETLVLRNADAGATFGPSFMSTLTMPSAAVGNIVLKATGSFTEDHDANFVERTGNVALTSNASGYPDALVAGTVSGYTETPVEIGTVVSSHTLAISSGTFQTATLTASTACTFTMPTATAGQSFILLLKQAATTGAGTAAFTGVKWPAGVAPTITATAAKMDLLSFASDGTNWYGSAIQNFTP